MVLLKNLILRNDILKDIFKECSSEKMDFLMKRQGELQDKIDALGAWDLDTKLNIAMDA